MRVITLPNGRQCSLGVYLKAWRTLKSTAPDSQIKGWDHFPTDAAHVLNAIRHGVQDRINIRGNMQPRECSSNRVFSLWQRAHKRGAIVVECKSCGSVVTGYINPNNDHSRRCAGC